MKKVLRIRESELKEAIRNSIKEELGRELLLTEMARVGFMDQGRYEIYVWTDDPGNEPHIHIRDYSTHGEKFETCVKLRTNEYFLHNGYTDMFNRNYSAVGIILAFLMLIAIIYNQLKQSYFVRKKYRFFLHI